MQARTDTLRNTSDMQSPSDGGRKRKRGVGSGRLLSWLSLACLDDDTDGAQCLSGLLLGRTRRDQEEKPSPQDLPNECS